ncbi:zinc finger protein 112-like [Penaeus indicus]|uniref:zinc finger protein 112-like n=1 Tax=Penaeus indicus TaxID=29960 RepID=UPI00300C4C5B
MAVKKKTSRELRSRRSTCIGLKGVEILSVSKRNVMEFKERSSNSMTLRRISTQENSTQKRGRIEEKKNLRDISEGVGLGRWRAVGNLHISSVVTEQAFRRSVSYLMSFLADGMPLASVVNEGILGTGISIKEELSEDISKDICLEIKEEQHEADAKDSCDLVQDHSDVLRVPLVAEDCWNNCSPKGDQAIHKESLRDTEPDVEPTLKCLICEACGKKFSKRRYLNIHMRVHTKEKPYRCDICDKGFPSKNNLVKHIRVHTKEKPYSCEICNKAFSEKGPLVTHIRIHIKEKPFNCEICNKAFSHKNSLVRHTRVHTKEKLYTCEICNKNFSHRDSLIRHMSARKGEASSRRSCRHGYTVSSTSYGHTEFSAILTGISKNLPGINAHECPCSTIVYKCIFKRKYTMPSGKDQRAT